MPKLTYEHLRGIVIGCGVLLIGMGLVQGLLHVELDEKLTRWLSNGLFVVAAIAFLQMRRVKRQADEAAGKGPGPKPG